MLNDPIVRRTVLMGWLAVMAASTAAVAPVHAQEWPTRTINIIVPSAAGDGSDITARVFSEQLQKRLGQAVVVENRTGAGGTVGTAAAARAAADGHTLIMGNAGSHGINAAIYPNLSYDVEKDFAPISLIFRAPNIFVASPALGVSTIAELVERMRAAPDGLSYASGGPGSSAHLNSEYLKLLSGGVKGTHVPYRGATPALNDVVAGHVAFMSVNLPPAIGLVRERKVTPLAVTSARRAPQLPDVPTMVEAGFPGYETVAWFGLLAPAATPPAILRRLGEEVAAICAMPDVRSRLEGLGGEAACLDSTAFRSVIANDVKRWREVARAANIKVE